MGKGTNATHINEGLYTIDYQYDTDAITARIATLTARLGELNSEQGTITSDISTKESDITLKENTIDQNIDDLNDLKSELSDLNSDLDDANTRLDEIPDEITEQEDLLAPIDARMLVITVFLAPIQASIASKQAALAEATDPDVIAQLTSEIEALQEQETILSDEYGDLNEQKTPITTAISDLQTEQSTLQGTVSTLEGQITSKESEITTLRDTKHSNESDLSDYRADLLELEAKLASIKLQIASTQRSIDTLTGIPTSVPGTYAWCADRTEDLSGEVGIMEVAGFEDSGINIQPGWVDPDSGAASPAVYDGDRDGIMVPAEATSGAQSFWNKAMQGGWQKWRPTFRWGTITVIDYELDTCSVTMSTETNPDTGLDVNKMATLSGVPIEYMSCNSAPFVVGDTVVVKFTGQSWSNPVVIGFTSEPKSCYWEPWGDTICENHVWTHSATAIGECPSVPVDYYHGNGSTHIHLTDSVMYFANLNVTYGGGNTLYCSMDNDTGKTPPKVGKMKIKVVSNSSWFTAIRISVDVSVAIYVFEGSPLFTEWTFVGDNGGEEMEIDLTTKLPYGADITEVRLYNYAYYGGTSTELWVDYISFI